MTDAHEPRRTALHALHAGLGARFTEFGGWEMPVRYGSIIEEHQAVRTAAGLFDLSHMGELRVSGAAAPEGLAAAFVNDARRLAVGRAHYSLLCAPDGGIIDDVIVYRLGEDAFLVVPNASNREVVAAELRMRLAPYDCALEDETLATSLLAVQGPRAASITAVLTDAPLEQVGSYGVVETVVAGIPVLLARTGYTGEDGFELFCPWEAGPSLWQGLADAGRDQGLVPCGLGARDTLRLEAGMPLYGAELDRDTDPFEAGLGWVVRLDRDEFVARDALAVKAASGPSRQRVGLVLQGRGIARHGYPVTRTDDPEPVGVVTSGSQSPTLGAPIAMAYVPPAEATPGTMLAVDVRGSAVPAEVVPLPFYRRPQRR